MWFFSDFRGGGEIFISKNRLDMAKNILLFNTVQEYEQKRNNDYVEPWVSYTKENGEVNLNKSEEEKLLATPLTFEITGAGDIYWRDSNTIEYSKNGGEWTTCPGGTTIPVVSGDVVQFRGDNQAYLDWVGFTACTCGFKLSGNIMSLVNSTGFSGETTLVSVETFPEFFEECTGLTDASKLLLPATALSEDCYEMMFFNCTNLTTAPELPATTLAYSCYNDMFNGCTSLTTAPELPATTLASHCYNGMFQGCTSLTTVPELPATTLTESCYQNMFSGCTSLTTVPELPATTLTNYCYSSMFKGCTSLVNAPELPATTLAGSCYYGMFNGCTSLINVPELPATTLANSCYGNMFSGCTSLTTAPELPAATLVISCYSGMFSGCTNLNYIKCLATDISAYNCTKYWVSGVASLGTFVKSPNITESTWGRSANGIPSNWTVEDA